MPRRNEPEPYAQKIGGRIEDLRVEKNLSLDAVGRKAATGKGHLSNVERGLAASRPESLARIAKGLDERLFSLFLFPAEDRLDALVDDLRHLTPAQQKAVAAFAKRLRKEGARVSKVRSPAPRQPKT